MTQLAHNLFTLDEYYAYEQESRFKHEWLHGNVYAMAGGSPEHAAAAAAVIVQLGMQLRGKRCRVYSSDLRVRTRSGLATYPDVSVICGPVELDPEDPKQHTALNPLLLVEVLSKSTEAYDRGEKFEHYKSIPSLSEYVLVDPRRRTVERFWRASFDWSHVTAPRDGVVPLALGVSLDVGALFDDDAP